VSQKFNNAVYTECRRSSITVYTPNVAEVQSCYTPSVEEVQSLCIRRESQTSSHAVYTESRRSPTTLYTPSVAEIHLLVLSPIQWVPGAVPSGIKRLGREADHPPPCSAEVNNPSSYNSTPPYIFMARCLVRSRDFTFTFINNNTNTSPSHFTTDGLSVGMS